MRKIVQMASFAFLSLMITVFFAGQDAAAAEGKCILKAHSQDVFVIVFDMDDEGNQGPQIWQGRINHGGSVKITAPHGRFRYDYNDQPEENQPLSGGHDRWCNNMNTILVP